MICAWYQVGNYQIHLIVASTTPTNNPNEKWGRNAHIAFSVADLDNAKQELLNLNYPIQVSASGRPALFTQDQIRILSSLVSSEGDEGDEGE